MSFTLYLILYLFKAIEFNSFITNKLIKGSRCVVNRLFLSLLDFIVVLCFSFFTFAIKFPSFVISVKFLSHIR